MSERSSAIDDLHEAAFGFRPAKDGEAYERLAAVVFASLGWKDVAHDVRERPEGKRATHQLDVTASHPDGQVQRFLIECKDWDKTVGKGTLDTLVGVRGQIKADATAVVTTKGFTKGAVNVAVDENVALVLLTPFSENPINYVKTINLEIKTYGAPEFSDFGIELMPDHGLSGDREFRIRMRGDERFRLLDGSPAELAMDVLRSQAGGVEEGAFQRRVEFEDGRLVAGTGGEEIPIRALSWTETSVAGEPMMISEEAQGEPLLVLQQFDQHGEIKSGRVLVDRDLFAWDIDKDGHVTAQQQLAAVSPLLA